MHSPSYWTAQGGSDPEGSASTGASHECTWQRCRSHPLCINGHEYVKRQLAKEGIAFAALDNGVLSCADPKRLQQICDGLSAAKIDALLRKWLAKLPHPYHATDRQAG